MSVFDLTHNFKRAGRLEWIGLRPAHRQPMRAVEEANALAGRGLGGDRAGARPGGKRQVTLIQAEHLPVIAALSGHDDVAPASLRRNLLVGGINLAALHDRRFYVGEILLEGSGYCHPCGRMEEALGVGGYNAMRGHGGLIARVLSDGVMHVGDAVRPTSND